MKEFGYYLVELIGRVASHSLYDRGKHRCTLRYLSPQRHFRCLEGENGAVSKRLWDSRMDCVLV